MAWLFIIGGYALFIIGGWILDSLARLREHKASVLAGRETELSKRETELTKNLADLERERFAWLDRRRDIEEALETMRKEKSLGFPWLAKAYSDYFELLEIETAYELETK